MKKDKLKVYALEFILLAILSFTLFVSNIYNRIILAMILTVFAIASWFSINKRKEKSVDSPKVKLILIFFAVIYLIAFYLMGLYFGYYKSTVTFSLWSIRNYIIPIAVVIVTSEIIRNIFLEQNAKYTQLITVIIMVLIDVIIYANIYSLNTFDKIIEMIGFTLFASISCNLLYNYISNRYGIIGNIIYRLITVLYVYFIPYIPNVYIFFRSILRMIYPYIIYQVLEYTFGKNNMIVAMEDKRKNIISKVLLGVLTVIIAMLISCQFKYGILVIGSGSMTGAINKGDAIFFEQYDKKQELKIGEIVIFDKDKLNIVHRVVDVKKVNGEIRYITKGDSNQEIDEGYITAKDITGIYKFRIIYMGYPSLWVRDIFSN